MKYGKVLGATPKSPRGKPGQQELLPSRHAMSQILGLSPMARSINDYAKLTPSGANAPRTYAEIFSDKTNE